MHLVSGYENGMVKVWGKWSHAEPAELQSQKVAEGAVYTSILDIPWITWITRLLSMSAEHFLCISMYICIYVYMYICVHNSICIYLFVCGRRAA